MCLSWYMCNVYISNLFHAHHGAQSSDTLCLVASLSCKAGPSFFSSHGPIVNIYPVPVTIWLLIEKNLFTQTRKTESIELRYLLSSRYLSSLVPELILVLLCGHLISHTYKGKTFLLVCSKFLVYLYKTCKIDDTMVNAGTVRSNDLTKTDKGKIWKIFLTETPNY